MKSGIIAVGLVFCSFVYAGEQKLTYVDLVNRITDLEHLSVLPVPGEKCAQCSSYDRASRFDEATGKYVAWDANGDGGAVIRMEGEQAVLAEMTGPGCIWRIWSATAGKGHVKIYLNGASEPAVDLAFDDYFSRKFEPFTYPALVYKTAANGFDNTCRFLSRNRARSWATRSGASTITSLTAPFRQARRCHPLSANYRRRKKRR